ncbi:protein kinase domain-containing protein [Veronia pacifica]|nr:phosphotransferase [Veronia pacifica]
MSAEEREKYVSSTYIKHFTQSCDMWREWTALTECAGPGIQRVIDIDERRMTLTLEFDHSAKPLSELQKSDWPLFLRLLPSLIKAIRHCHRRGWVHGDLKPGNILYLPDKRTVRLIDFGASYRKGTSRKALMAWQATPMFASHQQVRGIGRVTTGDDWYSLRQIINQVLALI